MGHDWMWLKIGAAVAAIVTYAYATFIPRHELEESVLKRLDRIEIKLDNVIRSH